MIRHSLCVLTALALVHAIQPARAQPSDDPEGDACIAAFDNGQTLRTEAKLIAAKKAFIQCAQEQCPDAVEEKCGEWLTELETTLPSVIVVIPAGVAASELKLWIDDVERPEALQGRAVDLDPGQHVIRYQKGSDPAQEQPVVVAEGEQKKRIELTIAAPPDPDPAPDPTPAPIPKPPTDEGGISPLVFIGFGIAGAGAIVGGITGGIALSKASDLEDACPNKVCAEDQRDAFDSGNALSHVSTVSFAIAGAGAVLGVVGIFLSDFSSDSEQALRPMMGPGSIGIRGSF